MRVLVLDTYYPAFLADHYGARPALAGLAYEEQLAALMDRCFGTSDTYSRHLRELGHEAIDIVANCEPLQQRWASDHAGSTRTVRRIDALLPGRAGALARRTLLRRIALAQIEAFDPDVVYVQDLAFLGNRELDALSRAGRLLAAQIASVLPTKERLRKFDVLLTSFPHYVELFRSWKLDAEYLKIAFDAKVLDRLRGLGIEPAPNAPRQHAVAFVGGLGTDIWCEGTRVLERAVGAVGVDVWGYGADTLPTTSSILTRYHGEAWGLDMYKVLAQSRIVLNRHGEIADGYANNMRLYEASGVGALLVTEARRNLTDLFEPGREVVDYEDENDLIDKLRHYVVHDDERRSVAAAGQERTLHEHTYANRMAELASILEARLR